MSIKATVNPAAETTETTKEEQIADARENETALLDGLLAAADFKTSEECIKNVVISRNGKDLFSFHIHPLSEEDYNSCRKKFTKFVKSKVQGGIRVPLRYNYDKPEKPRISRAFGYLARFFILFQTEKSSREVVIS